MSFFIDDVFNRDSTSYCCYNPSSSYNIFDDWNNNGFQIPQAKVENAKKLIEMFNLNTRIPHLRRKDLLTLNK